MKSYYIITIIVVIIILYLIITRNSLVSAEKKIERNKSLIDVFLKKRFDLIPNLVEVCKGYSKYEKDTLERITKLRTSFINDHNENAVGELNGVYTNLIALVENYPELKASDSYLKLQKELSNVENELQASRRMYINSITSYNNLVMRFPSSIIAKMFNYKELSLPKYDYDDVKIDFQNNKE